MCPAPNRRIMLGELLVKAGVVSEDQLKTALTEQKKWGGRLGSLLVEMGFLNEKTLIKALSRQLGLARVDFDGLVLADEALKKLDAEFCDRHQVLPLSFDAEKNQLVVGMADPRNLGLVDEIGFRTGCRVHVAIAGEKALAQMIRLKYNLPEADSATGFSGEDLGRRTTSIEEISLPKAAAAEQNHGLTEQVRTLLRMQQKQIQVMKVLVELLVEKGYITRKEYRDHVERQGESG